MHCDKANNFEYDISCILYLNDEGVDFQGGEFVFLDIVPTDSVIDMRTKDGPRSRPLNDSDEGEVDKEIVYTLDQRETAEKDSDRSSTNPCLSTRSISCD